MTRNILLLTRSEMSLGESNFSDYLVNNGLALEIRIMNPVDYIREVERT